MSKRWDPDWCCPLCLKNIHGRKNMCIKCKTPKLKKGDWVCRREPCLQEFNFAARMDCRKCHKPKPTVCICTTPLFSSINVNGNFEPLGFCYKCLCPNPTPWYITFLDREETKLLQSGVTIWYYRIDKTGSTNGSSSGLGKKVYMHSSSWYFQTRDDVVTELRLCKNITLLHLIKGDFVDA